MASMTGAGGTLLSRFSAQVAEGETSDRTFGLTVGSIFLALSLAPLIRHRPVLLWTAVAGAALLAAGIVAPSVLRPVKRAWLFFGFLIGLVVSPVVLGILFYGVISPCGFLMRLFGGDPLRLRAGASSDHPQESFWRERQAAISTMKDQF
jgi:hypothetical protein